MCSVVEMIYDQYVNNNKLKACHNKQNNKCETLMFKSKQTYKKIKEYDREKIINLLEISPLFFQSKFP